MYQRSCDMVSNAVMFVLLFSSRTVLEQSTESYHILVCISFKYTGSSMYLLETIVRTSYDVTI